MRGRKKSIVSSIVSVVGVLLLLALIIGLIYKYTDIGDKIKDLFDPTFRIEYDGTNYTDRNRIALPTSGEACFKVKGVDGCRITVLPNVTDETDFTYEVGEKVYKFSQTDLSRLFVGENSVRDGGFYIKCFADYSLESVLSQLYDGAEVKVNGDMDYPYLLTFKTDGAEVSFEISAFGTRLTLSDSNVIF